MRAVDALERLQILRDRLGAALDPDDCTALRQGIESLSHLIYNRNIGDLHAQALLPSETRE